MPTYYIDFETTHALFTDHELDTDGNIDDWELVENTMREKIQDELNNGNGLEIYTIRKVED